MARPWIFAGRSAERSAWSEFNGAVTAPPSRSAGAHAGDGPAIDHFQAAAYSIPTDEPESDGTLKWDRTTMVTIDVGAAGVRGFGYSYASPAAAMLASRALAPVVVGTSAWDVSRSWAAMVAAVRNLGRPGVGATAISAVDMALWDLKARCVNLPLVDLLGRTRDSIPAYGSGGYTSYDDRRLARQLGGWAADGFEMVKMKVGRDQARDPGRVRVARAAVGAHVALFVDANGAYDRKGAIAAADRFRGSDVSWFEEPVSSDDIEGLRFVRDRTPGGMRVAAGEYGWDQFAFRRLLEAGAVDVLQADATRSLGITGFLTAAALCEAFSVPLSAHCAPSVHAHLMCAVRPGIHLEWFHDHARIEQALFDGAPAPTGGQIAPDRFGPGLGLTLRAAAAEPNRVWRS